MYVSGFSLNIVSPTKSSRKPTERNGWRYFKTRGRVVARHNCGDKLIFHGDQENVYF